MSAGGFPSWVLLEPYVFRRDDDASFPDDTEAPIKASGVTTCGARFRIAFSVAEPPLISRLYAQLPGFPGPDEENPLVVLATHRHLALLILGTSSPSLGVVQNFFIFRATGEKNPSSSSSLEALPPCKEPQFDYSRADGRLPRAGGGGGSRRRRPSGGGSATSRQPRLLNMISLGLWCGGGDNKEEEEFVVAELDVYTPTIVRRHTKAFADICLLRASSAV